MVGVSPAHFSYIGLRAVWKAQGRKCFYCDCGLSFEKATRDHFLPRCMGYRTVTLNLVACCRKCNRKKGPRLPTFDETLKAREVYRSINAPAWAVG